MQSKYPFQTVGELYQSDWYNNFANESDRGTVLIAAETLSTAVELLLKHVMPNEKADLFNGSAALANFSGRIDVSFALGLISNEVCRDLHLIRKIRNDFAHGMFALTFDSQSVANRIGEFAVLNDLISKDTGDTPVELQPLLLGGERQPLGDLLDTNRKRFLWEFMFVFGSVSHRGDDDRRLPTFEQWREKYNARTGANRRSILSQLLGEPHQQTPTH